MKEYVLPNLLVPGAAKSGTSSLHQLLNQHPDIFMSKIKEPHFFSWDKHFSRGVEHYSKLFEKGKDAKYRGESTTGYMIFPKVIERIRQTLPETPKFIFIFRNPIDRAYSHYWWLRGMGFEKKSFEEAFLYDMEEEPDPENKYSGNYKYYYQSGLYGKWIERFYNNFPKENIFVITTEQLKDSPLDTLNSCFEFLNLKKLEKIEIKKENQTLILKNLDAKIYSNLAIFLRDEKNATFLKNSLKFIVPKKIRGKIFFILDKGLETFKNKRATSMKYPKLLEEDRKFILEFYIKDFEKLQKLTGKDFKEWKDFYK